MRCTEEVNVRLQKIGLCEKDTTQKQEISLDRDRLLSATNRESGVGGFRVAASAVVIQISSIKSGSCTRMMSFFRPETGELWPKYLDDAKLLRS